MLGMGKMAMAMIRSMVPVMPGAGRSSQTKMDLLNFKKTPEVFNSLPPKK
jgi:hypothetical protein